MLARNVERKLTIFISSKMDERYYPIRRALKTLLMETGLVTHVYLFEQEASSQNTQDAYLAEVAKSDLCIFLIDNSDGVTDAVYREHKHASSSGVHRLYFFCNEHSNDRVPLQLELEQSGVTIYRPISEFAEIPQIAYERTLQDILDWYQKRDENPENNAGVQAHSIQVGSLLKLGKTVFSHYSSNNILVKTLNPYNEKDISEDNNFSSAFDHLCADFLRMVIGREPFSTDVFLQLSDAILSESSMVTNIVDVLQIRLDAIAEFYSGNLSTCLSRIFEAHKQISSYEGIPEWLVNDIAIDMRNIRAMLDQVNNRLQPNSEGQLILDQSAETVYYPLLDRFAANQKEKLLEEYYEIYTKSPYTNRIGTKNGVFEDTASCFNVAVRFGSLTHILATRDRYEDVLFAILVDCEDATIFCELSRMYILTQDEKSLNKVFKSYRNSIDSVTVDDIRGIIESIDTLPFKHKRFESICLTLEYYGYYMSDEQYKKQEEVFFDLSHEWCGGDESRIIATGSFILQTALSIIGRSDNTPILELVLAFLRNRIWRFIDEALEVIEKIDYAKCTNEIQKSTMELLITLLSTDNLADHGRLYRAIIAYRKKSSIDLSVLDIAVEEKDNAFYTGVYDLEIRLNINPLAHIDKYMSEARSRIEHKEPGVYYTTYSYEPLNVIRNILAIQDTILEAGKICKMITLIQDVLLDESVQDDAKVGAFMLSIYLRNTYPTHSAWEQFTDLITAHESEIINARYDDFFAGSSPNVIRCCYLLLMISLGCTSFEEVAIGFATMASYPDRDYISVLNYLSKYLSDADVDMVDNRILGIILNFVLSVGEDKHSDALYYAIIALIELLQSKSFADTALMRLSSLMKNANSNTRVLILREVSKTEHIKTDIGQHILQKGRTDNHYFVKNLANVITKSIQEP